MEAVCVHVVAKRSDLLLLSASPSAVVRRLPKTRRKCRVVLIKEFHFNVNTSKSNEGRTPLHEACLQGHTDLVRQLVNEHEANLSAKDNSGKDVLMYAGRGEGGASQSQVPLK